MEVIKGTDRTAYIGERYTFKVARSNPRQFIKSAQHIKERSGFKGIVKVWKSLTADQHDSLKNFLFHGVVANRRESRLAKQHDIVIPTRSLLQGLVNVQPTVSSTGLDHTTVHSAFVEYLGPRVTRLGHMLEDTNNVGVVDGQVRFRDGGSVGLEALMQTQPNDVRQALGSLALQVDQS